MATRSTWNPIQWTTKHIHETGVHLVWAELMRRGYKVRPEPEMDDLKATSKAGRECRVRVRAQAAEHTWLVELPGTKDDADLYYVLVSLGNGPGQDRYFIMSQADARACIRQYMEVDRQPRADIKGRTLDPRGAQGFLFRYAVPFKDQWNKL
jgi:hypothetical protein